MSGLKVYLDKKYDFLFWFEYKDILLAVAESDDLEEDFWLHNSVVKTKLGAHIVDYFLEDFNKDFQHVGVYIFDFVEGLEDLLTIVSAIVKVIDVNKLRYAGRIYFFANCCTCERWVGIGNWLEGCNMVQYGAEDRCDFCA